MLLIISIIFGTCILFSYDVYHCSIHPDIYTGLGLTNHLINIGMVDIGVAFMLYFVIKTLTAKHIVTAQDLYKKYKKEDNK